MLPEEGLAKINSRMGRAHLGIPFNAAWQTNKQARSRRIGEKEEASMSIYVPMKKGPLAVEKKKVLAR